MAKRGEGVYGYRGSDAGVGAVLPGVRAAVLGLPTLEATDKGWSVNQAFVSPMLLGSRIVRVPVAPPVNRSCGPFKHLGELACSRPARRVNTSGTVVGSLRGVAPKVTRPTLLK
jgi:hypothetical protein